MASKGGQMVAGTDGSDFGHRERVAAQYRISATSKSRLKSCLFTHTLLFFLMFLKLLPDLLDRLDIFILEIEELEVPKPLAWEYAWCCSVIFIFYGLSALRRNQIRSMLIFAVGIVVFALAPVLFSLGYYVTDVWQVLQTQSTEGLALWQGFSVALLWYAFLMVALQVHLFTLYFAHTLLNAWKARGSGAVKKIN